MKPLKIMNFEPGEKSKIIVEQFERDKYLRQLNGWQLVNHGKAVERNFKFKNFHFTMDFVNAIADIANSANHHPDLKLSYGSCNVVFTTHEINGLSMNDLICAAKVSALIDSDDD